MQRILAIQIKRIGDLVLTAPALRRLRRERPDAHITLLTLGVAGQLVACIPGVDEHLNYRVGRPNLALWAQLALGRFDVVLDFNGTDRAGFMAFLSHAAIRAGYEKRARKFPRSWLFNRVSDASLTELHTVDHMVALLETLGIDLSHPEPLQLVVPEAELVKTRALLATRGIGEGEKFALIHPGTARAEKYWLAQRWAAVADHLATRRGLKIVVTGGADSVEKAHIEALKKAAQTPLVDLSGKLSLLDSAAVISLASLALGVDTAAMHLAGAFEIPQVLLYGPTNPYHWRPRHTAASVVLAGRDAPLTKAEDFEMRIGKNAMNLIEVDQVLAAVESLV